MQGCMMFARAYMYTDVIVTRKTIRHGGGKRYPGYKKMLYMGLTFLKFIFPRKTEGDVTYKNVYTYVH